MHGRPTLEVPAPKPGLHLATAQFQRGEATHLLHVLEGPVGDTLTIRGTEVSAAATRAYRFRLTGSLIAAMAALERPAPDRPFRMHFEGTGSQLALASGEFVPGTPIGAESEGRRSGVARYRTSKGELIPVSFPVLRRGWLPLVAIIGVGLALACGGCASAPPAAADPAPVPPPPPEPVYRPQVVSITEVVEIGIDLLIIELRFYWEHTTTIVTNPR